MKSAPVPPETFLKKARNTSRLTFFFAGVSPLGWDIHGARRLIAVSGYTSVFDTYRSTPCVAG
ncbi:MAG: hypothetical protein IKI91_03245, partial [Clostridia bacterium]|nr:hypothetical protein [Clostridia bacterium]